MSVVRATTMAVLMMLGSPPALQQQAPAGALVDALAACLDIRDDRERLACTDTTARRLVDATRRKDVVVVDKVEVAKTKRSLFGFTLPKIGLFGGNEPNGVEPIEIDEIEAPITSVAAIGQGRYALTIEGGARWTTTEPWTRGGSPARGVVVKIRKAALGSYFIKIGSGRAVRAMRTG